MRVEDWHDIRRRHEAGEAIKAIARTLGVSRNTVRRALTSDAPPVRGGRPPGGSVADGAEARILELLAADPRMSAAEIGRRIGWRHSPTVLKDRVRSLRARFPSDGSVPAVPGLGDRAGDLTSFIGRGAEVAEVRGALTDRRLVSLTGPGGVGKTRLAWRVAASVADRFPGGVRAVDLSALREEDLLAQTILDAMDVPDRDDAGDAVAVLVGHLRHREVLLLLDNCEHLLGAAAAVVAQLLAAAPRLRVLATSREPLGIGGEHVVPVAPLGLPDATADVAEALDHPAVALFSDRATAVLPGFAPDGPTVRDMVEVCRRLDGIPLAIELATARLRVLSVRQLLDRLDDVFAVLADDRRVGPERHRTLQATIAWSHDLCTPAERALWSRAGVFAGTFDLDALDAVCTDAEIRSSELLDGVCGLAAKSLLIREETAGKVRFRMLETVREFGHEQLPRHLDRPLRTRHRDWALGLVDALVGGWFGPDQLGWSARMGSELANLRTALDFSLRDRGSAPAALRLVGRPWFLWATSVSMTEHRRWLGRALAAAPAPTPDRARALGTCALVASLQGDQPVAAGLARESLEVSRELRDPDATAFATHQAGMIAFFSDDFDRAEDLLRDTASRYGDLDAPGDQVGALDVHRGLLHISQGRLDEAADRFGQALSRCAEAGESWVRSYAVDGAGFIALLRGDIDGARRLSRQSLELASGFDDTIGLSLALDLAAWTAAAAEQHERSAILLGAASSRWHSFGQQLYGSPDWQARREGYERQARLCLGGPAFDAAHRHGAGMDGTNLIEYALREGTEPVLPGPGGALTAREWDIARRVAGGLTNRMIAERLVLSHRTVEGHVGRVLGKLGFTRRAQLAAWVARQDVAVQAAGSPSP